MTLKCEHYTELLIKGPENHYEGGQATSNSLYPLIYLYASLKGNETLWPFCPTTCYNWLSLHTQQREKTLNNRIDPMMS